MIQDQYDIAIVGAGAAGLMAAIWAGRTARQAGSSARVVVLDGSEKPGAKILVAGGGRCNVTHFEVDESQYAGSSRNAIKKVLRRFDVTETVEFFRELGVELKREDTGKLFPTTDDAHTVLNALFDAARDARVEARFGYRVESISRMDSDFLITPSPPHPSIPSLRAARVILATGGLSLPKTGSDGHGYSIAKSLGHSMTQTFPALVPLTIPRNHFICGLSGVTVEATVELRSPTGKRLQSFTNSTLCTHFGLSGPSVLDISRYYMAEAAAANSPQLFMNWLPNVKTEELDAALLQLGKVSASRYLRDRGVPDRLADALCYEAGVDPAAPGHSLTRDARRALARQVTETPLPINGTRGYLFAEVTAGGVPLSEVHLDTMESRICPGLHLCGEICDVDGRIGGFNFQWAWASGFVAGTSAAKSETDDVC